MSVTKGHGFEGLYLVLGPVTRVVRVTAWVPAVPTGEAEPSLHDEPLKQQGIAAALGRGTDERASDAPPPSPTASQKAHTNQRRDVLDLSCAFGKDTSDLHQEETLPIHLDTATSGFERKFENNKHCGLGSCFFTECGLSGFWDPAWV